MDALIDNRYQVVDAIGQGGMGIVYRAQDRLTGNEVALKQVLVPATQLDFARSMQKLHPQRLLD